ncbi:MAG: penicillin-binding protein 2 [Bifidobacteriaceae bacterium]|nr:penicillin-binding protein 2 [Bifidobacteriaceae bacterium]
MNKSLRIIFCIIIAMFAAIGLSTTNLMVIRADDLNADGRNARSIYSKYDLPRGAILASDGTIIASSAKSDDEYAFQRTYPYGSLYAPVTGYFSILAGGQSGIEESRDSLLAGTSNSLWIDRLSSLFKGTQNQGASIETSISPQLQTLANSLLTSSGYQGTIIVTEPSTGRILAMVNSPSYDPGTLAVHDGKAAENNYNALNPDSYSSPLINRATSELYAPGSTFKILVSAAALETGEYQPDTEIPAGAYYTLPGTSVQLPNSSAAGAGTNGKMSLENALAYSSNTAFAQLGVALGQEKLENMARKLGMGSTLTIDSSDSANHDMAATASVFPKNMTADKLALASIGQGDVQMTPLLDCMMAATVANGGVMMKPSLVDRVRGADLSVISETKPQKMSSAFSEDTAQKLTSMMIGVMTKEYPELALSNGTKVAAKTGTAERGDGTNDSWFTGFAPADNPKVAVTVLLHKTAGLANFTNGTIFKKMIEGALSQ